MYWALLFPQISQRSLIEIGPFISVDLLKSAGENNLMYWALLFPQISQTALMYWVLLFCVDYLKSVGKELNVLSFIVPADFAETAD